jgi:hypothetical protein
MITKLSCGSGSDRTCGGNVFTSACRVTGSSCGNRGFGISGIPDIGNAAPSKPCANDAIRRFIVGRPVPWISHPAMAYCPKKKEACQRIAFGGRTRATYVAFIPEQLDQLPIVVLVRPRCGRDPHDNRLGLLDPLLELFHCHRGSSRSK